MPDDSPQSLAALVARFGAVPRAGRSGVFRQLLPFLADDRLPAPVRVAAAARVLKLTPDRPRLVRRVARALTKGLSPSRGLERLRHLQNQLDESTALDAFIDAREQRVKLACPRCRVRLPRMEMVKHLWHEHGLALDRGKVRPAGRVAEELREQHAKTGDPAPLDRVASSAGAVGLRRWLANDNPVAEELAPLLTTAADHGAGLCPACFAELPAAVAPLPEALALAKGRLSGEGFAVAVGGTAWFRTERVTTPDRPTSVGRHTLAPRAEAALAAAVVLLVGLVFVQSLAVAAGVVLLAFLVYAAVRSVLAGPVSLDEQAINTAWTRLAPKYSERSVAAKFLTRLCLASLGRGEPESRARVLNDITIRAAGKASESDAELQLLAAARVLQVEDGARYGRDVVAGIATLAADGFAGTLPADYAEFVVGCFLTRSREAGDLARLRVLLIGAAFAAGLVPRDLIDLWAGAPNLRKAMAVEPAHRLGLLFGLWRTRRAKAWQSVADADTVFDFARTSPPTAARILARYPDLLLYHRPDAAVEALVGPVMVCGRGVAVEKHLTADPDADVRLTADGRELLFGRHRLTLPRRLPDEFPELLKQWLRFRAERLLPFIDGYLSPGSADVSRRVLGPFCRRCLACGAIAAVTRGAVGQVVPRD